MVRRYTDTGHERHVTLVPGTPLFSLIYNSSTLSTVTPQVHIILLDLVYHERKQGDVNQHGLISFRDQGATGMATETQTGEEYILRPGNIIGKFRVVKTLGQGGLGQVYEAVHITTGRTVALKILLPEVARRPIAVTRFQQEGRLMGDVRNSGGEEIKRHFPEVFDSGYDEVSKIHYLALEFFSGRVLDKILEDSVGYRLERRRAINLILQALTAIAAMHRLGIIHRDLKPDNLMVVSVERDGAWVENVTVLDLGIAKSIDVESKTSTGTALGTPYYMSPEQCTDSSRADHRSDIYALGVILYEAIAGCKPFDRESLMSLMALICNGDPTPLPDWVDDPLKQIITKAMARRLEDRYQTADEFAEALGALDRPVSKSPTLQDGTVAVVEVPSVVAPAPSPSTTLTTPPPAPTEPAPPRAPAPLANTQGQFAMSMESGERPPMRRPAPLFVVLVAAVVAAVVAAIALWPSRTPTRRPAPVATSDRPVTPVVPTPVATPEPPRPTPVPVATPEPPRRNSRHSRGHRRQETTEPPTCVRTHVGDDSDGTAIYAWRPVGCVRR